MVAKNTFADWLKGEFEQRNWETLRQAELYLGIGRSSLGSYLSGKGYPNRKNLKKIAAYFKKPLEELASMIPEQAATPPTHREGRILSELRDEELGLPGWVLVWIRELEERGLTPAESASVLRVAEEYLREKSQATEQAPRRGEADRGGGTPNPPANWRAAPGDPERIGRHRGSLGGDGRAS